MQRSCLNCGMEVLPCLEYCPKCDALLSAQSDGSIPSVDIAHNRETIAEALQKMRVCLDEIRMGHAQGLRLIVGRGLIREDVMRELSWLKHSGAIMNFDHDEGNTGAILVQLKPKP